MHSYYTSLEKASLFINHVLFATELFNISKSFLSEETVEGEEEHVGLVFWVAVIGLGPLALDLKLREETQYFQAQATYYVVAK